MADVKNTVLIDVQSNLKDYADEAQYAAGVVAKLQKELRQMKKDGKADTEEYIEKTKVMKSYSQELRTLTDILKNEYTASNIAANDSLKQLKASYAAGVRSLEEMSEGLSFTADGQVVLTDAYIKSAEALRQQKVAIDRAEQSMGIYNGNVGNYQEAITSAFKGVRKFSDIMPAATAAQKGLNNAMKANPIGFIVTAIAGLITWLSRLEGVQEAVKNVTVKVSQAFQFMTSVIKGLFNGDVTGEIKKFHDGISGIKPETVEEAIERMGLQIDSFKGKLKDSIKVQKEIMEDESETFERRTNAAEKYYEKIRTLILNELKLVKDTAASKGLSFDELESLEQQLFEERALGLESAAVTEAKYAALRKSLGEDQIKKFYDLTLALGDVQDEEQKYYSESEAALKEYNSKIRAEQEAERLRREELRAASINPFGKSDAVPDLDVSGLTDGSEEARKAALEQKAADLQLGFDTLNLIESENYAKKKEILRQKYQTDLQLAGENAAEKIRIQTEYTNTIKGIEAEELESHLAIQDAKVKAAMDMANILGSISDLIGKGNQKRAAASKALAYAEVAINTGVAMMTAVKANSVIPEPGGAIARGLAIASIVASAAKSIAAINKAQVGGGGGSSPSGLANAGTNNVGARQRENAINNRAQTQAMSEIKPVVTVEDINAKQNERIKVVNRANV
jgi:hypothetical protein